MIQEEVIPGLAICWILAERPSQNHHPQTLGLPGLELGLFSLWSQRARSLSLSLLLATLIPGTGILLTVGLLPSYCMPLFWLTTNFCCCIPQSPRFVGVGEIINWWPIGQIWPTNIVGLAYSRFEILKYEYLWAKNIFCSLPQSLALPVSLYLPLYCFLICLALKTIWVRPLEREPLRYPNRALIIISTGFYLPSTSAESLIPSLNFS